MAAKLSPRLFVRQAYSAFCSGNMHSIKNFNMEKFSTIPSRSFVTSTVCMEREKERALSRLFYEENDKNKETFLAAIDKFMDKEKQLRGHVDFIYSALKYLEAYGVHKDLEVYKKLINVMPKGKMVPVNVFQQEFSHYPRHQDCIAILLEKMESHGVIPDTEVRDILVNTFGKKSSPFLKFARMRYWMPKFKNACPWPLPEYLPSDSLELAKLAIKQITSIDPTSKIEILQTSDIEDSIDKTWIVSSVSFQQSELIGDLPKDESIKVEGPFGVFLREHRISYFVLRAETKPFKPPPSRAEMDDVSELYNWMVGKKSTRDRELIKKRSIHEQDDGIILGICATGTSSRDSLLSWIRLLEKSYPKLSSVPVLFTQTSPIGEVMTVSESEEDYKSSS